MMGDYRFDIEQQGPSSFELLLWDDRSAGGPESLGHHDTKLRAWIRAKDVAAERSINPGEPPWLREVRLPTVKSRRAF